MLAWQLKLCNSTQILIAVQNLKENQHYMNDLINLNCISSCNYIAPGIIFVTQNGRHPQPFQSPTNIKSTLLVNVMLAQSEYETRNFNPHRVACIMPTGSNIIIGQKISCQKKCRKYCCCLSEVEENSNKKYTFKLMFFY